MKKGLMWVLITFSILLLGFVFLPVEGIIKSIQKDVNIEDVSEATDDEVANEKEEIIEPKYKAVTVSVVGDVALGKLQIHGYEGSLLSYYDSYGEGYFFENVKDVFENDDVTIANLECVLTDETQRVEKTYNIKGEPKYTGILQAGDIEMVGFGNNHNQDYGEASMTDTINALNEANIPYALNEHTAVYETDEGIVVGVISASLLDQSRKSIVLEQIANLKNLSADVIIVCPHWGIEHTQVLQDFQINSAHEFIDAGADAVIGSHPHVLQGMEVYNGKVICYSMGNFCFGGNRNPDDKETAIFQQTFYFDENRNLITSNNLPEDFSIELVLNSEKYAKSDNEPFNPVLDAKMIPCTLSSVSYTNDFKPTLATDDTFERIIQHLNEYSKQFKQLTLDEKGRFYCLQE